MNRHILAGSDGSPNAEAAIRYIAHIYQDVDDVDVTVMTVSPPLPPYLLEGGLTYNAEKDRLTRLETMRSMRNDECARVLERARHLLKEGGLPPERIHAKAAVEGSSPAKALLLEARTGRYDAVVLGRRGLGQVVSYFMGSVTYGVVQSLKETAVWIVDTAEASRRVLVAVDACEPCLRVVDHAAFALAGVPGVRVTLYHVIPRFMPFFSSELSGTFSDLDEKPGGPAESSIRAQLSRSSVIFEEAGFNLADVEIKIRTGGLGVAREISREYGQGGYGTLVVGRRGVGGLESVFPGSVSMKLLSSHSRGAIWIMGHE